MAKGPQPQLPCPHCDRVMRKASLARHIEARHPPPARPPGPRYWRRASTALLVLRDRAPSMAVVMEVLGISDTVAYALLCSLSRRGLVQRGYLNGGWELTETGRDAIRHLRTGHVARRVEILELAPADVLGQDPSTTSAPAGPKDALGLAEL